MKPGASCQEICVPEKEARPDRARGEAGHLSGERDIEIEIWRKGLSPFHSDCSGIGPV